MRKSEKSWIDDPAGISWETFLTSGENTEYGDGSGEREARIAHAEACCMPAAAPLLPLAARNDHVEWSRPMKLYMFEHCSLCFRVRMIAALKRMHLQETVVLEDDTETMVVARR